MQRRSGKEGKIGTVKLQIRSKGPEAFTPFENAMKRVLSGLHSEIQRRIEEHPKEGALNPNELGPKPNIKTS
jgi:hypothetical protein